jgi:hypothetical protein
MFQHWSTGRSKYEKNKCASQEKDTVYKNDSGLQKFCLSNHNPQQFLELVKSGDINLHPKNEFFGVLKACSEDIKSKKSILLNLRKYLYEQVFLMFYAETDVYLYSKDYINDISQDIYILTMPLIEESIVDGISEIIKEDNDDEKYEDDEFEMEDEFEGNLD